MNRALTASAIMIALGLTACATPTPQAVTPALMPARLTGAAETEAVWPDVTWWNGFADPQLTKLITEAHDQNRDVATAAARIEQAQAQVTIERAALFPRTEAQTGYTNGRCRGQSCQNFTSGGTFSLGGSVGYTIDVWGLTRDNVLSSREQLKFARYSEQAVSLMVAADTANQYFTVLATRRRIAIAHENIRAINSILSTIELRVKAGSTSQLDLAREQAQLEAVEAQLPRLETGQAQALHALAVLIGRTAEGFEVTGEDLTTTTPPSLNPGLPSSLLIRRPDVAQAEAILASAHANLDAARAAFLPQISLTGSGGFVSAALGALVRGPNAGYDYGAQLLQTIFDDGQLRGRKHLALAQQKAALATYEGAILSALADTEDALTETLNAHDAREHLNREVQAARTAFEISELQYRQGATDLLNVLQAQQTLFSAEDSLAQANLASDLAAVHLYQALGGGWIEAPADRTQFVAER